MKAEETKSLFDIMNFIKRYWYYVLLILFVPIAINYLLLIPVFSPIVGDDKTWLAFWGNYSSALITSTITLFVLYRQLMQNQKENEANRKINREENERNRETQYKLMQYQIASQNLHLFKESCIELCKVYNYNTFVEICNLFVQNSLNPMPLINKVFSKKINAERLFLMNIIQGNDAQSSHKINRLMDEAEHVQEFYVTTLLDLQAITSYLNLSKEFIKSHILKDVHASEQLKKIIIDNFASLDTTDKKKWLNTILNKRMDNIDSHFNEVLWDLISEIYLDEKKRINKILL